MYHIDSDANKNSFSIIRICPSADSFPFFQPTFPLGPMLAGLTSSQSGIPKLANLSPLPAGRMSPSGSNFLLPGLGNDFGKLLDHEHTEQLMQTIKIKN